MYDVVYVDRTGGEKMLAHGIADRDAAGRIARKFATEFRTGRMVLPGSVKRPDCVFVVPVTAIA